MRIEGLKAEPGVHAVQRASGRDRGPSCAETSALDQEGLEERPADLLPVWSGLHAEAPGADQALSVQVIGQRLVPLELQGAEPIGLDPHSAQHDAVGPALCHQQ